MDVNKRIKVFVLTLYKFKFMDMKTTKNIYHYADIYAILVEPNHE